MNKKIFFIILFLGIISLILFLSFVSPILITTFSDGLNEENLSFAGNENIRRNLSISRYVNVTSAYMNLSGLNTNLCYQESANIITSCGGLNTGTYDSSYGSILDFPYTYDGNWSSYGERSDYGWAQLIINYTKPSNFINAIWQVKFGETFKNYTLPTSCINWSDTQVRVYVYLWAGPSGVRESRVGCYQSANADNPFDFSSNGAYNFENDTTASNGSRLYEEAIIWDNFSYLNNVYVSIPISFQNNKSSSPYFMDITEVGVDSTDGTFTYYINDSSQTTNFTIRDIDGYAEVRLRTHNFSIPSDTNTSSVIWNFNLTSTHRIFRSNNLNCAGASTNEFACYYNFSSNLWTDWWDGATIDPGNLHKTLSIPPDGVSNDGKIAIKMEDLWVFGNVSGNYQNASFFEIWVEYNISSQIWNYTGVFDQTNNKTSNFALGLNTILNNGKCDCLGCYLVGNNCSIPLVFHSDIEGILQYSDIQINYDPLPIITLISPENDTHSSSKNTFTCNTTDEINLKNITLYIWNSTSIYNNTEFRAISGISNSTTFTEINFSRSDVYKWNCLAYNNNSYSNWHESNYTLNVEIINVVINLNAPTDNFWLNYKNNIYFNYTPSHSTQTVSVCELWENWTGTWAKNLTDTSITENVVNSFVQNVSDGTYKWNVWCNTSETGNSAFSATNFTLNIDTIFPVMNNMSITTTANSNQITFLTNITDLNLATCKYSIWTGSTPGTNTTFTCNSNTIATAPGFGTYNLHIYASDLAGNENNQNLSFTTSISSGTITIGGGSPPVIIGEAKWTMKTDDNQGSYKFSMLSGSSRTRDITFYNIGTQEVNLNIRCEGELCKYLTLSKISASLPVGVDIATAVSFTVNIPKEIDNINLVGNLIAKDSGGFEGLLTVQVSVGRINIIIDTLNKLSSSKNILNLDIPYIIIALLIFVCSVFILRVFLKHVKLGVTINFILSFLLTLTIIYFI